jgi:hypothetical protein
MVLDRHHFLGQLNISHDAECLPINTFRGLGAGAENIRFSQGVFFGQLIVPDKGLFLRIDDDNARGAVDNNDGIIFNNAGGFIKAQDRRDFKGPSDNAGMGRPPPPVGDEPFDFLKLNLAGVGR